MFAFEREIMPMKDIPSKMTTAAQSMCSQILAAAENAKRSKMGLGIRVSLKDMVFAGRFELNGAIHVEDEVCPGSLTFACTSF